ncbi:calcium-binding protein [Caulobacter segnis]|uniref:EF-Hand domain protein n=2 Tax=Caulobacter segnis TaxID=88688 RepID=D5VLF1_CAUST|nr:calcium-binding protein [Caulobacter segnis]ADG11324.1 EF-Hand domain protein [Caulobacter segnis ATCC 21756]AVQ02992.1 calcium-binding protein [Caulobacter segnis]
MRRMLLAALATCATVTASAALAQDGPPPGMPPMPAPEDIFKRWDANADGAVDLKEWTGAGRPEDRFAMIDANKDGKISLDELKAAFEKMRQRRMQQGDGPPPGPPPEGPPPQGN